MVKKIGDGLVGFGIWSLVIGFCLLVIPPPAVWAAVPQAITFQGRLTGADIPASGTVTKTIVLQLYDAAAGGRTVGVAITRDISITDTIFTAEIPVPAGFTFPAEYWVGIKVGADPEMTPRQHLTSVPYAFRAAAAESIPDPLTPADGTQNITGMLRIDPPGDDPKTAISAVLSSRASTAVAGIANGELGKGIHGVTTGQLGYAVQGDADLPKDTPPAGITNYGGHFTALGQFGRGVYGEANEANAYGIHGKSDNGYSGYFEGGKGVKILGDVDITGDYKKNGVVTGAGGGVPDPLTLGKLTVSRLETGFLDNRNGYSYIRLLSPQFGGSGVDDDTAFGGIMYAKAGVGGGYKEGLNIYTYDNQNITLKAPQTEITGNLAVGGATVDSNIALKAQHSPNTYGVLGRKVTANSKDYYYGVGGIASEEGAVTNIGVIGKGKTIGVYGEGIGTGTGVIGQAKVTVSGVEETYSGGLGLILDAVAIGAYGSGPGLGVWGAATKGSGVWGTNSSGKTEGQMAAVLGINNSNNEGGPGVKGESLTGFGIVGSGALAGVFGSSTVAANPGIKGSGASIGILGESNQIGVKGVSHDNSNNWSAIYGYQDGTRGRAGEFEIDNVSNSNHALRATTKGTGKAIYGRTNSDGGIAIYGMGGSVGSGGWDFYAEAGRYGSPSSIRWKENIQLIDKPLEKILSLRGVYFDWKKEKGGHHDVGMIGEEVGKVLPEVVGYESDGSGYVNGMDYGKLTPLLVEAIKEQQKEIDALKVEIAELKAKAK